jgi:hypothetical protein
LTTRKKENVDQLSQNYREMDETGREKLKDVAEHILNIWDTVNDGKNTVKETNVYFSKNG